MTAYGALFHAGARQAARDRADQLSTLLIYASLLIIFAAIYGAMPLHEMNVPGLTAHHLLWYFAITECITCGEAGFSAFGRLVGAGELTSMMQRPASVLWSFVARQLGAHTVMTFALLATAEAALPLAGQGAMPLDLALVPLLLASIACSLVLYNLLSFMGGAIEIFGPYSRPFCWILGKLIFTFGGLLFPVAYFPPVLQAIAHATPFYAVLGIPGELMLMAGRAQALHGLALQLFWIAALAPLAVLVQRGMLRRVMQRGD